MCYCYSPPIRPKLAVLHSSWHPPPQQSCSSTSPPLLAPPAGAAARELPRTQRVWGYFSQISSTTSWRMVFSRASPALSPSLGVRKGCWGYNKVHLCKPSRLGELVLSSNIYEPNPSILSHHKDRILNIVDRFSPPWRSRLSSYVPLQYMTIDLN